VVLVMGGSQGSRAINAAVGQALDEGRLSGVALLWSTGAATHALHAARHAPPGIQIRPFWDPIALAYAAADLVVARAGAMTLAELAAWGLPSVLIPLPTAAADHQSANAVAFAEAGAAVHLPEPRLTAVDLADAIHGVLRDPRRREAMAAAAGARGRPDAANAIAERLLTLL
jgi:UDP-N-acetylglucosamine--N-acetylmuramyl-(pentapeptide) pyrophosphoryl-undecaprenol N-acetylglucosamine transferase